MTLRFEMGILFGLFCTGCAETTKEPVSVPDAAPALSEDPSKRLAVGPVSFETPKEWEVQDSKQSEGLVLFAPERPEWKEIGFRPNLGVLKRVHPGVSLDRYREKLNETLGNSVQSVNAVIAEYKEKALTGDGPDIRLKERAEYNLFVATIDKVRVLSSKFSGVYTLPKGAVGTTTYGMQILTSDALYSIALTFPDEFKEEMETVWSAFEKTVRIEK